MYERQAKAVKQKRRKHNEYHSGEFYYAGKGQKEKRTYKCKRRVKSVTEESRKRMDENFGRKFIKRIKYYVYRKEVQQEREIK